MSGREGVNEVGVDSSTGEILIEIDPRYYRPTEVELLIGDPTKAKEKLGWKPRMSFEEIVKLMVKEDEEFLLENRNFAGANVEKQTDKVT